MYRLIRFSNHGNFNYFSITSSELLEIFKGLHPLMLDQKTFFSNEKLKKIPFSVENFLVLVKNNGYTGFNDESQVITDGYFSKHRICSKFTICIGDKEYLSLVNIPENTSYDKKLLPIFENCDGTLTMDILNTFYESFDIQDITTIDGNDYIIFTSWDFEKILPILGYETTMDEFCRENDIEYTFEDGVFYCDGCETWQWNTNGMMYNYVMNDYGICGISCGCAVDHEIECIEDKIIENGYSSDEYIRRDTLDEIKKNHPEIVLTRHAVYITGMCDGQGGWYDGTSCDESDPDKAVELFFEEYPDKKCIVVFLEAGQFQSYFAVYAIETGE